MYDEIEKEYNFFLEDMKNNSSFGGYFNESHYEQEYSVSEIEESQSILKEKIKEWLHNNKPGQYIICHSYCVFVMTIEKAKEKNIINYELRIVK